jgi:hypothetical protein
MKTDENFHHIALISSWTKNVSDKICRENQNALYLKYFFFPKILPIMR